MAQNVAPWLQGLSDEDWEIPAPTIGCAQLFSASHDASAVCNTTQRGLKRSMSGLPSRKTSSSQASMNVRRCPLAPLDNINVFREGTVRMPGTRSVSARSDASSKVLGTVQHRSKSASPAKTQYTMEWNKRLVRGEVGYGDQTDLFGPSGLESLFSPAKSDGCGTSGSRKRMSWLQQNLDATTPSSPPPWPSGLTDASRLERRQILTTVGEEGAGAANRSLSHEESSRSNPFELNECMQGESRLHKELSKRVAPESEASKSDEHVNEPVASGRTELEQEDFSPVYVSKHTTIDGQVAYGALDGHLIKQFPNMTVGPCCPSQPFAHSRKDEDKGRNFENPIAVTDRPEAATATTVPDISLSEDLPTGTPPVVSLNGHVELQRGGYSRYGSFKSRPLSPSPARQGVSEPQHDASGLVASQNYYHNLLPPLSYPPIAFPKAAYHSATVTNAVRDAMKMDDSFNNHYTFSESQRLERSSDMEIVAKSHHPEKISLEPAGLRDTPMKPRRSFGSGELDSHGFNAEVSVTRMSHPAAKDGVDHLPASEIPAPGSKTTCEFKLETSPKLSDAFESNCKMSKNSSATSKNSTQKAQKVRITTHGFSRQLRDFGACFERAGEAKNYDGGKRPPTSPFKSPTPKRRRTLQASEMTQKILEQADQTPVEPAYDAACSKKRKDAKPGQSRNLADPDVLASRRILRPRNPTPSQRRRWHEEEVEAELKQAAEDFAVAHGPDKLDAVIEQIESSIADGDVTPNALQKRAEAFASEVANFTLRVQKPSGEHDEHGERKRSVTTQDFFNEAMKVMSFIRAQAQPRPNSGLASVHESDAESRNVEGSDVLRSKLESLRVSRPPSREGRRSGWRSPKNLPTDARVISHLRKFQEKEDTEFIADSFATLHVNDQNAEESRIVVEDEEARIRISRPQPQPDRKESPADAGSRMVSQHPEGNTPGAQPSQRSDEISAGRTLNTSSTRKSDNVGTLAPDAVAHLIGEQVGGMVFDRESQRWLRVRSPEKRKAVEAYHEPPSHLTSDDDPFREISDLPVDEQKELRRVSGTAQTEKNTHPAGEDGLGAGEQFDAEGADTRQSFDGAVLPHLNMSDGITAGRDEWSGVLTRGTQSASSQAPGNVESRATSWNDADLSRLSALGKARHQPLAYAAAQATLALRQVKARLPGLKATELADLHLSTLAKSSGRVVSTEMHDEDQDLASGAYNAAQTQHSSQVLRANSVFNGRDSALERYESSEVSQTPNGTLVRPLSDGRRSIRPMNLLRRMLASHSDQEPVEKNELSLVADFPGHRTMSVSLSVSRPFTTRHLQSCDQLQSSPCKKESSFTLSELPDFTVHDEDGEQPSEKALATRLAQHAVVEVEDRFALAVKGMVHTLTDLHGSEPYWEDLKQLDLHDCSLVSLYGLEDFCNHVRDLDVSNNELTQLEGAPKTIRSLRARSNQLGSLTCWTRFTNLQYLDICNNQLESLHGLSGLIHLRELCADDNRIESLDGVLQLDGLLKLRLRRNLLTHVEFVGSALQRMTELDLAENAITSVHHLDRLIALESLKLDHNPLHSAPSPECNMKNLRDLSLQHCGLDTLDVSHFSQVQILLLDDNHLATILGIASLHDLHTLSFRRQSLSEARTISLLSQPLEVRTLRLSGNNLRTLNLPSSFLNLQELEVASVGLQDLAEDFGLRVPNVRSVNLNFNALKDLRPLLNIQRLENLSIAGNRLTRLRKSTATLARMSTLKRVDLRDNPLTQGFYPPPSAAGLGDLWLKDLIEEVDAEQTREAAENAKHTLPSVSEERDHQHQERLDEDTKLRRRVYEMLLACSCPSLTELDGVSFDRKSAKQRDEVWSRLVELGIVRRSRLEEGNEE